MKFYNIIIQKVINTTKNIYDFTKPIQFEDQYSTIHFINPNASSPSNIRINAWNHIYKNEIDKSNTKFIENIEFYIYIDNLAYCNKFQLITKVFENPFYSKSTKHGFLLTFCKIQKTYFALVKFVKIVKHKISKVYNTTDILMNSIVRGSTIQSKQTIEIYQNKKIYLFTRPDIINIFNSLLSHSPNFFSDPLPIKNPYNNMFFKKSDLYNMYFFVRSGLFVVSSLIETFFLGNFDLKTFQSDNEFIIRDYYINNYVENTPVNILYNEVNQMLITACFSNKIRIHQDFPKEKLVNIMRPYLLLYFQSLYSLDEYKRSESMDLLIIKLIKFYKYNSKFGRRNIKTEKYINCKRKISTIQFKLPAYRRIVTFNDDHISFSNTNTQFMTSHI
jgi:hypothetical protein